MLDATLRSARSCGFDQLVVTLGGAAREVRSGVDLRGLEVVENHQHDGGCSSSIAAALRVVDGRAAGIVLLLGDQPGVAPSTVRALVEGSVGSPLGICRYENGLGHPFWLGNDVFEDLLQLHGDKAVWKLLESGRHEVAEVLVPGAVPLDVDTPADYAALLALDRAEAGS